MTEGLPDLEAEREPDREPDRVGNGMLGLGGGRSLSHANGSEFGVPDKRMAALQSSEFLGTERTYSKSDLRSSHQVQTGRATAMSKFAALATLAPLLTLIASFLGYSDVRTGQVAIIFYVFVVIGVLLCLYSIFLGYSDGKYVDFDGEGGTYVGYVTKQLRACDLYDFGRIRVEPGTTGDAQSELANAVMWQGQARIYCRRAKRAATTARAYFAAFDKQRQGLRIILSAETSAMDDVINVVMEVIGREPAWWQFWAVGREQVPTMSAENYTRLLQIDVTLKEIATSLEDSESFKNYAQMEMTARSLLALKYTALLGIAQICLNVGIVLNGSIFSSATA